MALTTSSNKFRVITTSNTSGLATSSKFNDINSPALVVNTSEGGVFYATGDSSKLIQLAALPGHTHSYLPLSGGTVTGPIEIKSSAAGYYNEGLRITAAWNDWAGITFGSTGLSGAPTNGWFAALTPEDQFIISPNDSTRTTGLTLNAGGDAKWRDNTIIHSGNIGSQSVANANNANALGNYTIDSFMTYYTSGSDNYVGASFTNSAYSKVAGEKYIEYWDSVGGWFNSQWGKVTAHFGFTGNLTGNVTGNVTGIAETAKYLNVTSLGSNKSINTKIGGLYSFYNGTANGGPTNGISSMLVMPYSNDWGAQFVITAEGPNAYIRSWQNSGGVFQSEWTKFITSSNYTTYCSSIGHTHDYLPISGGTISGNFSVKPTNIGYYQEGIRIYKSPSIWAGIAFGFNEGEDTLPNDGWWVAVNPFKEFVISAGGSDSCLGLRLIKDGDAYWRTNKIIHSGNYSTYALPITGGTVNGSVNALSFIANQSEGPHFSATSSKYKWCYIRLNNGDSYWDIATKFDSDRGNVLWLGRYKGYSTGPYIDINGKMYSNEGFYRIDGTSVSYSDHTHNYLSLSGGDLTGNIKISSANFPQIVCNSTTAGKESNIRFEIQGVNKGYVGYIPNQGTFIFNSSSQKYLAINDSGVAHVSGDTILTASNYGSYCATKSHTHSYLPLSGGTVTGTITATNFITSSDKRLKTNIKSLTTDSKSLELNFYEFDYKDNDNHSAGHIAQEVKEVYPELVHGNESETEHLSIDYTGLHSIQIHDLINYIKRLEKRITELESKLS